MDAPLPLLPRALVLAVEEALADTPVVCLLGPRQSGKTTLARSLAPDRAFVSLVREGWPGGLLVLNPEGVLVETRIEEIR